MDKTDIIIILNGIAEVSNIKDMKMLIKNLSNHLGIEPIIGGDKGRISLIKKVFGRLR